MVSVSTTRTGSLQRRVMLVIGLTTGALVAALWLPVRALITHSFERLEHEQLTLDAHRAFTALEGDLDQLRTHAGEYATWDDTVAFLQGIQPAYEATNLQVGTFTMARLDFAVLVDAAGQPRFTGAYDANRQPSEPPPLLPLLQRVRAHPLTPELDVVEGLIALDGALALVCAFPIRPTSGEGNPHGTLIFGRWLDEVTLARLAASTRLDLTLWRASDPPAFDDLPAMLASPSSQATVVARDAETVTSYVRLTTLDDEPVALLGTRSDRAIVRRGRNAATVISLTASLSALVLGGLTLLLMHLLVTRRLTALDTRVSAITAAPASGLRVGAAGDDEIGRLSGSLDAMLDAVDQLRHDLDHERDKSDRLLRNLLPGEIAARLRDSPSRLAERVEGVAVLFADIVGFTALGAEVSAEVLVGLLEEVFTRLDALAEQHGVEKIKTIGDAYMAVCGVPRPHPAPTSTLVAFAVEMHTVIDAVNAQRGTQLSLRVGVHTGPVVAGVIGRTRLAYDLWGDTVNIASRMESTGAAGQVQVSDASWKLLHGAWAGTPRRVRAKGRGELVAWLIDGRAPDGLVVEAVTLDELGEPIGTEEVPS